MDEPTKVEIAKKKRLGLFKRKNRKNKMFPKLSGILFTNVSLLDVVIRT